DRAGVAPTFPVASRGCVVREVCPECRQSENPPSHMPSRRMPRVDDMNVPFLVQEHQKIITFREDRERYANTEAQRLNEPRFLYSAFLNNPIANYDALGLKTIAECDADYDACIEDCKARYPGSSSAVRRNRCLCYSKCMAIYAGCLATADETLIVGGCIIVGGVIIYCTGGAAAPAVCCAL
ncbi:MAG: hypothetical protein WCS01_12835, partial [bacterium]